MLITGYTAEYMQALANENVVDGAINSAGHLMLVTRDGTQIDAGYFGLASQVISAAVDFRDLTTPGTYLFMSSTVVTNSTNAPNPAGVGWTSGLAGHLLVEGNGGTFVKQTWTNYNGPSEVAIQTKYNTTWYTWSVPVKAASTTRMGLVELATEAETAAQTDGTKAVTPLSLASSMLGYRYLTTAIYTSSGSFAKASYAGIKAVKILVIGGGGGGGACGLATTGNHSCGGGGGGGGRAESFVLASALATTETVTVGAGGTSNNVGGASSFGTKASATGGENGGFVNNTPVMVAALGGSGGFGSVGDIKSSGDCGKNGTGYATLGHGGGGGSSYLGGGAVGTYDGSTAAVNTGLPGQTYGGGGSGASANTASIGGASGGAGAQGIVLVEVYV